MAAIKQGNLNSLSEAAEQLGVTVSCLRSWIYRGSLPYVKIGRCVRVSQETIEKIIANGTVAPRGERQW